MLISYSLVVCLTSGSECHPQQKEWTEEKKDTRISRSSVRPVAKLSRKRRVLFGKYSSVQDPASRVPVKPLISPVPTVIVATHHTYQWIPSIMRRRSSAMRCSGERNPGEDEREKKEQKEKRRSPPTPHGLAQHNNASHFLLRDGPPFQVFKQLGASSGAKTDC